MHKVRAAIVASGASAYRLIADKAGQRRRRGEAAAEPSLDPRLVSRADRDRLSRQEMAAAIHNLRNESVPEDSSLAHWLASEEADDEPLLAKCPRGDGESAPEEEASLAGEIIPRRVSRTADTRREDRIAGLIGTAMLSFRGDDHLVRVVNTSPRGLQVESDLAAHIAEELVIRVEGAPARPCYVRWVRSGRIGLGFREQDL